MTEEEFFVERQRLSGENSFVSFEEQNGPVRDAQGLQQYYDWMVKSKQQEADFWAWSAKPRLYGFDDVEVSQYFGISLTAAGGLIALGNKQQPTDTQLIALREIDPIYFDGPGTGPTEARGSINWGLRYLSQHPRGSHYSGDFNVGNALDRFVTINPQSFTPGNILRSIGAGATAFYTGGLSVAKPEINGTVLASSDTNVAGLLDSSLTGANSLGMVRAGDPNVKETFLNKLARVGGGAVGAAGAGGALASVVTPVSGTGGGFTSAIGSKVATAASGLGVGNFVNTLKSLVFPTPTPSRRMALTSTVPVEDASLTVSPMLIMIGALLLVILFLMRR